MLISIRLDLEVSSKWLFEKIYFASFAPLRETSRE
jgi:hypothetical protein